MGNTVLKVEGMSCEHCVKAIKSAVAKLPGVTDVQVDLNAKIVVVEHDAAQSPREEIMLEIEGQGYDVVG